MSLQSTDFTPCFLFLCVSARIYLGRLIAGWNYLPWQSMVLGKPRVVILLSYKWDLKGLPYLCFPCPLDRGRKRCCPLGGAFLFPAPGGVGDLLGGAPQSRWDHGGPPCSVTTFQQSCSEMQREGKCCALWVFRSDQAGGEEEQAARCRLPVVHPHLSAFLCFPIPPCLSLTSRQSYSMACSFHPVSGHAVVAQESLCLAGVLYLNAMKSIMAAAYVWDCAWGRLRGDLCGQHPLSWAAEL